MRVREAQFAATVPWNGILGKPTFVDGPAGNITIDDVQGLRAALAGKQPAGGLARVATSGNYNDLNNKPDLGSAAFADASAFVAAPTDKTYQRGQIDFVAGQQIYPVIFSVEMKSSPDIETQFYIADGTAEEMFYGAAQAVDAFGFNFWLNTIPVYSRGWCIWKAKVQ